MSSPAGPPDQRAAGPRAPSAWNLPNYLTVFRFVLVPVFGWLLLAEGGHVWGYRLAALVVFGIAMLTDSIDGDLGIMPGHTPLLAVLAAGEVRIETSGRTESVRIDSGFLSVDHDRVVIVADNVDAAGLSTPAETA